MSGRIRQKRWFWFLLGGIILLIIAAAVFILFNYLQKENRGIYSKYAVVVVAEDTPQTVRDELFENNVTPVQYIAGSTLLGGSQDYLGKLSAKNKIYICEGTYETNTAPFIILRDPKSQKQLEIIGAGRDKVKITGGKNRTENVTEGILIEGFSGEKQSGLKVEGISLSSFEYGVRMINAEKITLSGCEITNSHFMGIALENVSDCILEGNELIGNGKPETENSGYGLSFLYDSKNNKGSKNRYKNNGNKNAVEFAGRGTETSDSLNSVELITEFDVKNKAVPIKVNKKKPGDLTVNEEAEIYELENAAMELSGCIPTKNNDIIKEWSGTGYVFLATTKMSIEIEVEAEGYYSILLTSTTTDGSDKCDKLQINGGEEWLVATPKSSDGQWVISQPGKEFWKDGVLTPKVPTDGFLLKKGVNKITITSHWGNCCYDTLIIEPQ